MPEVSASDHFDGNCTLVQLDIEGRDHLGLADRDLQRVRQTGLFKALFLLDAPDHMARGTVVINHLQRVTAATPQGGMYAFLRIDGEPDSLALAKRLVADHGLGLAPGAAFGDEGEGWLRWCFASQDPARLVDGVARLARALQL